ncbi:UDP-3-O-(3-hydroxymyristoyl)glucosamine N-acyltransferase [Spongiibacter pelagi]|uniref:UDP-3-O-(3-hydroxymyristoyl)glucosamine N-acyltransferase n=1 Tax=Spongiibacter pelagi TaxID=2760804 RepID=UPI00295BB66E|nr:UDP-3-O-(3-hydroxymyristoyl)glucosamine N-acyltransferase [Spongiibacter pelagi]
MQRAQTLGDLARELGLSFRGDAARVLQSIAPLTAANEQQLSFLANPKFKAQLADCSAGALIIHPDLAEQWAGDCLFADNPYLAYASATALFDPLDKPRAGIHPSAVVLSDKIHKTASIGANCVIEEGAEIGEGAVISHGTVVGRECRIGAFCYLHANVTLYHDVWLGRETVLHSGVVIGGDGFGFAPGKNGWTKIHQLGGVRIGERVEIGAASTIDRGALEHTTIGNGVILDDQTHIAHNVVIGDNTAMAGCCQVAGSAVIGKNCTFAGNVGVVGHITICDGVHFTARTVVSKSVDTPGTYSSGSVMMESGQWRKNTARLPRLDELFRRVMALEKKQKD